jgi:hypothetical protein
MTVFVGPNNSGKTLILREIRASLGDRRWPQLFPDFIDAEKHLIVAEVDVRHYDRTKLADVVAHLDGQQLWDLQSGQTYHFPVDSRQAARKYTHQRPTNTSSAHFRLSCAENSLACSTVWGGSVLLASGRQAR